MLPTCNESCRRMNCEPVERRTKSAETLTVAETEEARSEAAPETFEKEDPNWSQRRARLDFLN